MRYTMESYCRGDTELLRVWHEKPTEKEKFAVIHELADKLGVEVFYIRIWVDEEGVEWNDFGSWTTFVLYKELEDE